MTPQIASPHARYKKEPVGPAESRVPTSPSTRPGDDNRDVAVMRQLTSQWWPDERINATVSREFICENVRREYHFLLDRVPPVGEGLSDDTYLDWILDKSRKFFLILVDIGIPERIFALVDDAYDDTDLPIAPHRIELLRLSPERRDIFCNRAFLQSQSRFFVRGIKPGEHVRYAEKEIVPVDWLDQKTNLSLTDKSTADRVVLTTATCEQYVRLRVNLNDTSDSNAAGNNLSSSYRADKLNNILQRLKYLHALAHENILSVYGSYSIGNDGRLNILLIGTPELSLKSFLNDRPTQFKRLSKKQQKTVLLNWVVSLAKAVAWLHAHNLSHGAIRPSNIFIDPENRILLGLSEEFSDLAPVKTDVETYNFAAPEQWVRTAAVRSAQSTGALPSGSRGAARKLTQLRPTTAPGQLATSPTMVTSPSPMPQLSTKSSQIFQAFAKLRPEDSLPSPTRTSFMNPFSRQSQQPQNQPHPPATELFCQSSQLPLTPPTSPISTYSRDSNGSFQSIHRSDSRDSHASNAPIVVTATNNSNGSGSNTVTSPTSASQPATTVTNVILQSWQSHQSHTRLPADIFALAAICLELITILCNRRHTAFAQHRGAKNRTAGRGGATIDTSFHLDRNEAQVMSWIKTLERDAGKASREFPELRVVGGVLGLIKTMLARHPEDRPMAGTVAKAFTDMIGDGQPNARLDIA